MHLPHLPGIRPPANVSLPHQPGRVPPTRPQQVHRDEIHSIGPHPPLYPKKGHPGSIWAYFPKNRNVATGLFRGFLGVVSLIIPITCQNRELAGFPGRKTGLFKPVCTKDNSKNGLEYVAKGKPLFLRIPMIALHLDPDAGRHAGQPCG